MCGASIHLYIRKATSTVQSTTLQYYLATHPQREVSGLLDGSSVDRLSNPLCPLRSSERKDPERNTATDHESSVLAISGLLMCDGVFTDVQIEKQPPTCDVASVACGVVNPNKTIDLVSFTTQPSPRSFAAFLARYLALASLTSFSVFALFAALSTFLLSSSSSSRARFACTASCSSTIRLCLSR